MYLIIVMFKRELKNNWKTNGDGYENKEVSLVCQNILKLLIVLIERA